MSAKIAVIGGVNGNISQVFSKFAALHAKNNFSFALIAGDLFDSQPSDGTSEEVQKLLSGSIDIPVTTYFSLGKHSLPSSVIDKLRKDGEVCPNLFLLGRRTTIKTSEGIRIVSLAGAHQSGSSQAELDEYTPQYFDADAKSLRGINTADIVLTSDWPAGITKGSQVHLASGDGLEEQQAVADLSIWLKPRYHFSTSASFYEREPFFHTPTDDSTEYRSTRFISLADFGNAGKQKWIYAFSIDTKAALPATPPTGTTASPLTLSSPDKKRKALDGQEAAFTRFGSSNGAGHHNHGRRGKRTKGPPPGPAQCFFCLSNTNVATHLIASIGDNAYLTTAKGPLPTISTFPALGFPGHMLIIPLEHAPSPAAIPEGESRSDTIKEMRRYRYALQKMIYTRCRDVPEEERLGCVVWEISRAGGLHFHQQFIPIGRSTIAKGLVEAAFKVQAENESYPRFESTTKQIKTGEDEGDGEEDDFEREDYFRVWISDCHDLSKETMMTLHLDSSFRFDLQFGRKVLAKLLGLEGRSDWRTCGQTQAEEETDVEAFKAAFKEFDFSLDE